MRTLDVTTFGYAENLRAKQWPEYQVGFSCLEKGIAKEIENFEPTQLNTLLESFYAEIKKQTWLNLERTIPFHRKWFGNRLNNSLNCLAGLWTFLRLKDVKISLCIIVLIVRTKLLAGLNKLFSRALPLHLNYDKLSRIFSCTLLICNHIIFLCNLE